ncbi:hypothetical protein [Pseudomonas panipatensis]|uniref:Uncharacterized protein n=1 Tax=Pseudomonas panipatensis TaxID=428992 RepID=A0A1G8JDD6_9PSED|nr:hypothetical protein [Pseudomonas panipatensis]SDI29122.1 hypothetical protein SAMN05216272_107315 [Pseudomonas panipatensis]SMP50973.1 hypothetical protein SAMN06295951_102547 [Pseudomonas panipatensis]
MAAESTGSTLIKFLIDSDFRITMEVSPWVFAFFVLALLVFLLAKTIVSRSRIADFEIDEAEFGVGDQKIKLKPNLVDKQIAYKIWVELSTRKIGLPINLEDDVITEVYDSWFSFFSVTRELIKDVPVSKFQRKETEMIIRLSIDVLNHGLRPHLTRWQARYRRWYEHELDVAGNHDIEPQMLQKKYPRYKELSIDLLAVNKRLIGYRNKMYSIVSSVEKR